MARKWLLKQKKAFAEKMKAYWSLPENRAKLVGKHKKKEIPA